MEKLSYSVLEKLGDHIDTDVMTPGKYLSSFEPDYLASICLKDMYPGFSDRMKVGGFVVAGKNFGCGSSRETAPIALKAAGTKAIIAEEFARIFYRNAINIGLPCVACPGIISCTDIGDQLELNLQEGIVRNTTKNIVLEGTPIPSELNEMFEAGGLIEYLKKILQQ